MNKKRKKKSKVKERVTNCLSGRAHSVLDDERDTVPCPISLRIHWFTKKALRTFREMFKNFSSSSPKDEHFSSNFCFLSCFLLSSIFSSDLRFPHFHTQTHTLTKCSIASLLLFLFHLIFTIANWRVFNYGTTRAHFLFCFFFSFPASPVVVGARVTSFHRLLC